MKPAVPDYPVRTLPDYPVRTNMLTIKKEGLQALHPKPDITPFIPLSLSLSSPYKGLENGFSSGGHYSRGEIPASLPLCPQSSFE